MSKKTLYILWGLLFSICAALGFIPEPEGLLRYFMTALSVICFLPPAVLVYRARKEGDKGTLALIRNLSAASLGMTLVILVLSLTTALGSEALGNFLHAILVVVSSPMVCSQFWFGSLFLWACLLMAAIQKQK